MFQAALETVLNLSNFYGVFYGQFFFAGLGHLWYGRRKANCYFSVLKGQPELGSLTPF